MSTPAIYKIADTNPKLPCWLYNPVEDKWWFYTTMRKPTRFLGQCTHWCHSESYPTVTPGTEPTIQQHLDEFAKKVEHTRTEVFGYPPSPQPSADVFGEVVDPRPIVHTVASDGANSAILSADVEKVAEEIFDSLNVELPGGGDLNQARDTLATILRRHNAEKAAEIVRLTEVATKRLISLNATDDLLKTTEQRAEKAEAELAEHVRNIKLVIAKIKELRGQASSDLRPDDFTRGWKAAFDSLRAAIDATKNAEMKRRIDTARETCRQAWTDAHEANARAERAEVEHLEKAHKAACDLAERHMNEKHAVAAEVAALKAEVERLTQDNHNIQDNHGISQRSCENLRAKLAASERRLREAEKDSERLDWLCRPWESQMRGKQTVSYTMENIDGSFRSAIDAARSTS